MQSPGCCGSLVLLLGVVLAIDETIQFEVHMSRCSWNGVIVPIQLVLSEGEAKNTISTTEVEEVSAMIISDDHATLTLSGERDKMNCKRWYNKR